MHDLAGAAAVVQRTARKEREQELTQAGVQEVGWRRVRAPAVPHAPLLSYNTTDVPRPLSPADWRRVRAPAPHAPLLSY